MELDDSWDPDPLPSCSSRNQSQPRSKKEKTHHSSTQPELQPHYYQQLKTSHSQHRGRNAPMKLYQNFSDDESSSDEYPVVLQQPQINHKRVISPAQSAQDRRKRHQSEHPSRFDRGRTTKVEEVVYDHISAISRSRNKSVARNDAQYKVRANDIFEGYQNVANTVAVSRESVARSHSRARDLYENQGYTITEDYSQQFDRQPSVFSPQKNAQTKGRTKEGLTYESMPPVTDAHRPAGRDCKETSRANHESVGTPKQRQRHGYSRAQSLAPRTSNGNSDTQYLGTENGTYSVRTQRQGKGPQLRSPLWSSHDSAVPKPSSANILQGRTDKSTLMKPLPHTPNNQSVRIRSVASDRMQSNSNQARTIDYGPIDDDDVYETPLEIDLRRRSKSHARAHNGPMNFINALPKSSVFRRKNSEVAEQVHQTPSSDSNRSNNSGVTIDLVTPESTLCARSSMPFIPQHWTPTRRGPIRVSTSMELSYQDGLGAKSEQQPGQNTHRHQANESSPHKGQQPEENIRQQQAAEKIIRQELNADNEALQEELFGAVIGETEGEKREREEAKRLEAQRLREEREKQDLIDAERKRKKNEARAKKESERKAAEQAEKEKEVAAKKAKRDAERHHQSLKEQQNADERRKAANKLLQEKREKDLAAAKAAEEKAQAAEKERKENDAKFEQMKRQLEKLEAQVKAKSIAELKPARKPTAVEGVSNKVNSLPPQVTPSTSMEIDNEIPLSTTQTQLKPVNGTSNTEKTLPPQATLPTNIEVEDEDTLFVSDNRKTVVEATPGRQISNGLQNTTGSFSSDSTIVQSIGYDRPPTSMTEIFAKTILNPSGDKTLEDRDAEREAIRKNRANENAAAKQKRAKSIPAEPNLETVAHKAALQATPKAPTKSPSKKKRTQSLTKSLGGSIFSVKLQPLAGHEPEGYVPREQPEEPQNAYKKTTTELTASKPRPLPLSLPLPLPPPVRSATTSSRLETRLISQAEREEIEANRQRVQAAAQARKENSNRARLEEKKAASAKKRTVEYRKRKGKELIEEARKEGRVIGDSELEARLNKLMEKREREIKRKRNRAGEKTSSYEHERENEPAPGTSIPNDSGMVVAQVSSSDTTSDSNQIEDDDNPLTLDLKEHKIKTAEVLKERAQSHAARRTQPQPVKRLEPIFDSDESEESEEDPIDDETLEMMMEQARKNNALTEVAKTGENNGEIQSETRTAEEIALEKEIEDLFEKDPNVGEESQEATATLNPDEHSAQIVPPMPNMTRYFESQSPPRSSINLETQSPLLAAPSQMVRTVPFKPQGPVSYKMVNLYMVMTQVTLQEYEDEVVLKKKFFDLEKANKHAQMLVNEWRTKMFRQQEILEKWDSDRMYHGQIVHDEQKTTKVFVMFKPMNSEDADRYDPTLVRPIFANRYYTIRFEKVVEEIDPETQKVCMTDRTAGFADASKLYTVLEMANHAAAEYLAKEVKPKGEVEEQHTAYEQLILPQVRAGRDDCIQADQLFCCEVTREQIPWADFETFEVSVEMFKTEGPIN
ncbi:uncharacterized protein Bfra_004381 [Botrytis fragariae]|uniref:Uncharacterized protein n=1 Tax=Botrytis fragariae TaxID=1964551 RepID=A0A8H6AVA6_9HELO|nr:uncharacterized protein Bfra_004381 [Botrytis fragariae]KAF5874376.1 hypothetical protein Bfra_004381 [Botrytis fragariae]